MTPRELECSCEGSSSSAASGPDTRDIFLTSEERYEIWLLKAAERPELLEKHGRTTHRSEVAVNEHQVLDGDGDDSYSTDEDSDLPLPLTDGCDIDGWRCKAFVSSRLYVRSVLNVGQGSPLLRRSSQLPLASTRSLRAWESLRNRLSTCTSITLDRVPTRIQYLTNMPVHPWFEKSNVPVILDGCTDNWPAMKSCTFDKLVERFGHLYWRFSDTHGDTLSLRTYQKYVASLEGCTDDAPLAIYDSSFGEHGDERECILDEYNVPSCFRTDLFELLEKEEAVENNGACHRPPYRWILIGPARSGTGLHIDPVGTHAWVTLVQGCKRWVLFPAGTSPESIHMQDPQIPSVIWFRDYYERVMAENSNAVELVQHVGETVYVPAGWPHLVVNLDLSVAITHNYATEYPSMERLSRAVQESEPEMLEALYRAMERSRPDLLGSWQVNTTISEKNHDDVAYSRQEDKRTAVK